MRKLILFGLCFLSALVVNSQEGQNPVTIAGDLALKSVDGNIVKLSSLQGNIVYLYLWASWNGPSIREFGELKKLYNSYKSKGFEIFAVSLDKSKADWLTTIRKNNLNWINVSDLKYWNSAAAEQYNIESIPNGILIDREGKIIKREIRVEGLKTYLAELLGPIETDTEQDEVLNLAQEMPKFNGSDDIYEFIRWVRANTRYPEEVLEKEIEGKALLSFVVNRSGKVVNVKIIRGTGNELLDKEAIRVVESSPAWTPGKNNGVPVSIIRFTDVVFRLAN